MHENIELISVLGIQGVITLASLAFCIYRFKKSKECDCKRGANEERFYSPLKMDFLKSEQFERTKSVSNTLRLPKRRKIDELSSKPGLIEMITLILEDSQSLIPKKLEKIVSKSFEENHFTNDQCISALSYEFVVVYGSEKIQQADVELILTIFSETINPKYKGYVEFLIILKHIEKVMLDAFDPKVILLSLLLVTSDLEDDLDEKSLYKLLKVNELEIGKVMSSITAVSLCKNFIKPSEEDVYREIDTIKAAIVRRSSRIRKTNK